MAVVVQCKNCGKRLKLVEPAPGKKVRCPDCKTPFDLSTAPGSGRSGGTKSKKGSSKSAGKSNTPLFVGIGVLAMALVGGLIWMLTGGSAETPVVDNDSPADPVAAAGDAAPQDLGPLKWMPAGCELLIEVDVAKLMEGPLGQLLQNPLLKQSIDEAKAQTGLAPQDISTVTIGMAKLQDARPRSPGSPPAAPPMIVVTRAKSAVDAAKLTSSVPNAETLSEDGKTFLRIPQQGKTALLWAADATTIVAGEEQWVRAAASGSSANPTLDLSLRQGDSPIQIILSPADPNKFFRSQPVPENGPPEAQPMMEFLKVVQPTIQGLGIGIDLSQDVSVNAAIRSDSPGGASANLDALKKLIEHLKQQAADPSKLPPQMQMFAGQSAAVLDSLQLGSSSDRTTASLTVPNGGQQIQMAGALMLPAVMQARTAARRAGSRNNLKQIAVALHNFHTTYNRFPHSVGRSDSGEEWLSWRVHLLPFLGQQELYAKFALEEPWDSPTNRPLVEQIPQVYMPPDGDVENGKTTYLLPVGPGTAFEGTWGVHMKEFQDGTSNTILVVEAAPDRAVYWTQPGDYEFNPELPMNGLGSAGPGGFNAALADASVRTISFDTPSDAVKAMFTRAGRDFAAPSASPGPPGSLNPPQ